MTETTLVAVDHTEFMNGDRQLGHLCEVVRETPASWIVKPIRLGDQVVNSKKDGHYMLAKRNAIIVRDEQHYDQLWDEYQKMCRVVEGLKQQIKIARETFWNIVDGQA